MNQGFHIDVNLQKYTLNMKPDKVWVGQFEVLETIFVYRFEIYVDLYLLLITTKENMYFRFKRWGQEG